jgi:hypothetical protein
LVGRLTLEEGIADAEHRPAFERLSIPAYDWWNEAGGQPLGETSHVETVFLETSARLCTMRVYGVS